MSFPEPTSFNGDEPDPHQGERRCDACEQDCGSHPVELPFGIYCSTQCAESEEAAYTERMKRAGFQQVQPDIFGDIFNPFGD
jgi:hypothetical protein